jgi:hypothetical protein
MDPYLEGRRWSGVHHVLCAEIARQLTPHLAPKYAARTVERFVMDVPDDVIITRTDTYPDVGVYGTGQKRTLRESTLALTQKPLQMIAVIPTRVPHVSIEIRDVAENNLVTAIEVLSPTNKRGDGYKEYLDKRNRILTSRTHLLEIDLLRRGERVPMKQPLPAAPYFIFLSRVARRPIVDVWPVQLSELLPTVPVPLLADDPDVPLDLQLALNTIYDAYRYDLTIDYARPPDVPLEGDEAKWAEELLRTAGIVQK